MSKFFISIGSVPSKTLEGAWIACGISDIDIVWRNLIALPYVVYLKVCLIIFSSFIVISLVSTSSK